jgi:tetraacyldisaccharide 4'-kinase
MEKNVHFISRGYGGKYHGSLGVDPEKHGVQDVGDEALLLAQKRPSWVAKDRVQAAKSAQAAGADVIIMDDGFQNPGLVKDFSLLVVDGSYGFGNQRLIPAGPLREPIDVGVVRANAVIIVNEDNYGIRDTIKDDTPIFSANMLPSELNDNLEEQKVIAFAGIGRPEKFHATLSRMGAEVSRMFNFADHHVFTKKELKQLRMLADEEDALLVTTAKDAVRLPAEFREEVSVVAVELQFDAPMDLQPLLKALF